MKEIRYVACSGGPDSMCLLSFLVNAGHKPGVLYFNHGTSTANEHQKFVASYCSVKGLTLHVGQIDLSLPRPHGKEAFWRESRYQFFSKFQGWVATAHTLDDVVETYILNTIKLGIPKLIMERWNNIYRPFLRVTKAEILAWNDKHGINSVVDPSNKNCDFLRNRVREKLMPEIKLVNPGIYKLVKKKLLSQPL